MSHYYLKDKKGSVKRLSTSFINLSVAAIMAVTGMGIATPLLLASTAHATGTTPVINEVSPASSTEWVEVYNPSNVQLSGWTIKDAANHTYTFGSTTSTYAVLKVGDLNNPGDTVTLSSGAGYTETVAYGSSYLPGDEGVFGTPSATQSFGRTTDGGSTWQIFDTPTEGSSNDLTGLTITGAPSSVDAGDTVTFTAHTDNLVNPTYRASDLIDSNFAHSASMDEPTGAFSWTPTITEVGSQTITVTATDGVTTETATVNITVNFPVLVFTPPVPTLTAPSNGTTIADTTPSNPPTLSWGLEPAADSYNAQLSQDSTFSTGVGSYSGSATSYAPSGPLADGTWYWRAQACGILGCSGWSSPFSFTVGPSNPVEDVTTHTYYPTIQAAVNGANPLDTIVASAGTYNENVDVTKPLTIEGANFNIAGYNTKKRGAESIVNGQFTINAKNVDINGFTIKPPAKADGVLDTGHYSNLSVLNNVINDANYPVNFNGGNTQVMFNKISYGANSTDGISANSTPGNDIHISWNQFSGKGSSFPADITILGGSPQIQDVNIVNNTSDTGATLVALFNTNGATVSGNHSTDTQGSAIYVGGNDNNVSISGNTVSGAVKAVTVANDFKDGPNSDVTVSKNELLTSKTAGVNVEKGAYTGQTVNARQNWWGNASGPVDMDASDGSVPASNPSGLGSPAVGAVDYSQWCLNAGCTSFFVPPVPVAPTGLYFTAKGKTYHSGYSTNQTYTGGSMNLDWAAVTPNNEVKEYRIMRTYPGGATSTYTILPGTSTPLYNFTHEGQGWYKYQVQVENIYGIWSRWSSQVEINYDTTTPVLTINSPGVNSYFNGSKDVTFSGTYTDGTNGSGLNRIHVYVSLGNHYVYQQYFYDGYATLTPASVGSENGTWTFTLPASKIKSLHLSTGDQINFLAVPFDNAGNGGNSRAYQRYITFDNTPPTVQINPPTPADNSYIKGHQLTINYSAKDNFQLGSADVGVKQNGNWIGGCLNVPLSGTQSPNETCVVNLPANADGAYVVTVYAFDAAGNESNWQQRTINVDNQPPKVKIWLPDGKLYGQNIFGDSIRLFADISDNSGNFHYKIKLINTDTGKVVWSGTPAGAFTHNFTNQEIKGFTTSNFPSGHYKVKVIVKGLASNVTVKHLNFTIDNTPPAVPTNLSWLDSNGYPAINGFTNVQKGTLSWQDSDPSVNHYVYKFWTNIPGYHDGIANAWTTDSSKYITTTKTGGSIWTNFYNDQGTYYFCVEAVDAVSNPSACSNIYSVTYDDTAPVVAITSPSNGDTLSYAKDGTVAIKGSVTDANPGHYYWKITGPNGYDKNQVVYDSSSFTNQTITNWDLQGLASGTYTIDLEARDAANNKGAASVQTIKVTVDNTKPGVPTFKMFNANGNPVTNGYINTKDFTFDLSNPASDGVTRYQLEYWNNITGSQFYSNSSTTAPGNAWSPFDLSATGHMDKLGVYTDNFTQGEGTHYFEFSACDAYDNCSSFSSPFQVTYDATDPNTPTASPVGGDYNTAQQVALGAVDPASIDGASGSGIASIYYTTNGATPSETNGKLYDSKSPIVISTDTTLKAIAYDNAGNPSPVMTETYDIAPVINQITLTPTTSSVTLVWNTNEPATSRVIYDTISHPTLGLSIVDGYQTYGYAFTTPEYNQAPNEVESHSVTVTGLTPGKPYYFRLVSSGSPATVSQEISSMTLIASTNGTPTYQVNFANTSNGNQGGNGTGTGGAVLGAHTNQPSNSGVKGDHTNQPSKNIATTANNSGFDYNWLWLLLLLLLVPIYYGVTKKDDEPKN